MFPWKLKAKALAAFGQMGWNAGSSTSGAFSDAREKTTTPTPQL
jgi:hypothetical protein